MWFKKRMEIRVEPTVRFLGCQEGQVELELKSALLPALQRYSVRRAYLARIDFGDGSSPSVALCLVGGRIKDNCESRARGSSKIVPPESTSRYLLSV